MRTRPALLEILNHGELPVPSRDVVALWAEQAKARESGRAELETMIAALQHNGARPRRRDAGILRRAHQRARARRHLVATWERNAAASRPAEKPIPTLAQVAARITSGGRRRSPRCS